MAACFNGSLNYSKTSISNITIDQDMGQWHRSVNLYLCVSLNWIHTNTSYLYVQKCNLAERQFDLGPLVIFVVTYLL